MANWSDPILMQYALSQKNRGADRAQQLYEENIQGLHQEGEQRRDIAGKRALVADKGNVDTALQGQQIQGQRTLAADKAGYDYGLQGQQIDAQWNQSQAHFLHEDELFNRQLHGHLAEQQLQQFEQERMAQFQAGQQEQRDYRLNQFDTGKLNQQQGFEAQREQFQAGQQEQRDQRLGQMDASRLDQTHDYDAQKTQYQDKIQQQRDLERQKHEVVLRHMALQAQEAKEEALRRDKMNLLSESGKQKLAIVKAKDQEKADLDTVQGLAAGKYVLSPTNQGLTRKYETMLDSIGEKLDTHQISQEEYDANREQIMSALTRVRRSRREATPEEQGASFQNQLKKIEPDQSKWDEYSQDSKTGRPVPDRNKINLKIKREQLAQQAKQKEYDQQHPKTSSAKPSDHTQPVVNLHKYLDSYESKLRSEEVTEEIEPANPGGVFSSATPAKMKTRPRYSDEEIARKVAQKKQDLKSEMQQAIQAGQPSGQTSQQAKPQSPTGQPATAPTTPTAPSAQKKSPQLPAVNSEAEYEQLQVPAGQDYIDYTVNGKRYRKTRK